MRIPSSRLARSSFDPMFDNHTKGDNSRGASEETSKARLTSGKFVDGRDGTTQTALLDGIRVVRRCLKNSAEAKKKSTKRDI